MRLSLLLWAVLLLSACGTNVGIPDDGESRCNEGDVCTQIDFNKDLEGNVTVIRPVPASNSPCITMEDCSSEDFPQDYIPAGDFESEGESNESNAGIGGPDDRNQGFFEGIGKAFEDLGRSVKKSIANISGYEKKKKREIERKIREAQGLADEVHRLQTEIRSQYNHLESTAKYIGSNDFYSSQDTQNQINHRGLSHNSEIEKLKQKLSTLGAIHQDDQGGNGATIEGYLTPEKKKVERTRNYIAAARQLVESKFGPQDREQRLAILDVAESASDLAEDSHEVGDNWFADELLDTARSLADIAVSSAPIVGGAYRIGNAVLGYNLITKQNLSTDDRVMEAAEGIYSLATGGIGSGAKGVLTASKIIKDIAIKVAKKKAKREAREFLKNEKDRIEQDVREAKSEAEGIRADKIATAQGEKTPRTAAGIPVIEEGKQGKHIVGHNNFDPKRFRSILTADPQELAKKAGTGRQVGDIPVGLPGSKERVDYGKIIGEHWSDDGKVRIETTVGIIHYSKKGIHIVPGGPLQ